MVKEETKAVDKVILEDMKEGEEKEKTGKILLPEVDVSALDTLMGKMDEFCDKRSLVEQDRITFEKMQREGKDPKNSFRVTGITGKGDDSAELNIVTSGEKGDESARDILSSLKKYKHVSVKSETSKRYEKEDPESCKEFEKWIVRTLDSFALDYRLKGEKEKAEELEAEARNIQRGLPVYQKEKCMGVEKDESERAGED